MIARSGAALVAAALTVVLAGCGSGAADTSGDGSTAPATSESSAPAASDSPETPTETESTPEVAPATGPVIKVKGYKVHVPEGWRALIRLPIGQSAYRTGVLETMIRVYRFPNSGLYTVDELGDEQAKDYGSRGRRVDDTELDGQPSYHLIGNPEPGVYAERFGTIVNDDRVFLEFLFADGEGKAERDEVIQSVLATARIG